MAAENKQFLYILKLIPELLNPKNWTEKEEDIINRHFERLQKLLKDGNLILAGKTAGIDEKTIGLVILEVSSEAEARDIMNTDPTVAEGIMTAELFPYNVALMRNRGDGY